ncbi:MAG: hypothetical protein JNL39_11665 [Opitutaceae bacterium]|nr:hypothetical protein [Opitutaceae bacterium]
MTDTLQQGAELLQRGDLAGPVTEVQVGKDADFGHAGRSEAPRVRRATGKIRLALAGLLLGFASATATDRAAEWILLHRAAMGGAQRIEALASLRATGNVIVGAKRARFTLLAARPARIRLETMAEGRLVAQGTDGVDPPWEADLAATPPRSSPMSRADARTFAAESEFDDPLVGGGARGFVLEDAGHLEEDGKRWPRLLVTRPHTDPFHLILDPVTFLIVRRLERRPTALGRPTEVVTRYSDFRPVEGVLLPHVLEVVADGRVAQRTEIERIEPNPAPDPAVFRRP